MIIVSNMNAFVVNLIRFLWSATKQNKIWIIRFLRQWTCSCIMSGYPSQANRTRHSHALMNERKAA